MGLRKEKKSPHTGTRSAMPLAACLGPRCVSQRVRSPWSAEGLPGLLCQSSLTPAGDVEREHTPPEVRPGLSGLGLTVCTGHKPSTATPSEALRGAFLPLCPVTPTLRPLCRAPQAWVPRTAGGGREPLCTATWVRLSLWARGKGYSVTQVSSDGAGF